VATALFRKIEKLSAKTDEFSCFEEIGVGVLFFVFDWIPCCKKGARRRRRFSGGETAVAVGSCWERDGA